MTATVSKRPATRADANVLPKCPTGIRGLDDITQGGLPQGRPTLVTGTAGCGKTLLAMEFVLRGAAEYGEPGVFVSFEERPEELIANVRSLGFETEDLVDRGLMTFEHVHVERSEIEETGEYDLEGLFIRLGAAVDSVGAKRIALDTIESLFSGLSNHSILRAELRRLFRWLKDRGLTAVITCERGDGAISRHGLEEYVSDCVILLDHRVQDQISTRRLRVVKYRGSAHGADEYPFLIDQRGLSVLPVTSLGLQHQVSDEVVSTGVRSLDDLFSAGGVYRGTTVLVSGTAGTGKTTLAAHFARAACDRGEKCLYVSFEESPRQIARNMRSVGVDVEALVRRGLLTVHAARPTAFGLELHLAILHRLVEDLQPRTVVLDPISNLTSGGTAAAAEAYLWRAIDFLKARGITAFCTSLTSGGAALEATDAGVSSLVDTWLLLKDLVAGNERRRALYVLKSRGMSHSKRIHEFLMTDHGIVLGEANFALGANGTAVVVRAGGDGNGRAKPERRKARSRA